MANFGPGYSPRQSALFKSIETRLAPWTSAYAVVGQDLAERYRQAGVPADKLRLIRSGVPIPRVDEDARAARRRLGDEYGIPVDRPWLIHVGSLEPRKNVLMLPALLQMLFELSGEERPHLVIAGVGPLETQLRNDFEAAGLSAHHTMLGFVNGVAPLMKASDVLLLLSSAEGLPQVLVQAASVDTPFVAFEVDGTREMVALGARGTLVELGDVTTAASAVADLLAKPPGPANIDLESWSPEEIRRGYRSLLHEVLANPEAVQFEAGP
jgi:glycosyltransferase involved in cell wall biosynthesis